MKSQNLLIKFKKIWHYRRRFLTRLRARILFRKKIKNFSIYCQSLKNKKALEIGGPSSIFKDGSPLPVYQVLACLDNCNFSEKTIWQEETKTNQGYYFHPLKEKGKKYLAEASNLKMIADGQYEAVLASHVIEHLANPLKALKGWKRILKDNGFLLLVAPHKQETFDHRRPVTILEHLRQDQEKTVGEDDLTHLNEILKFHDLKRDFEAGKFFEFKKRCRNNLENRGMHHHVFNTQLVLEMLNASSWQILAVDFSFLCHIIVLTQKKDRIDNSRFLNKTAVWRETSPFKEDKSYA